MEIEDTNEEIVIVEGGADEEEEEKEHKGKKGKTHKQHKRQGATVIDVPFHPQK